MNVPEPHDSLPHDQRRARRSGTNRRLRRSRERLLGGVVGGVADFLEREPGPLRWGYLAVVLLSLGVAAIPYLLLWWLLPGPE